MSEGSHCIVGYVELLTIGKNDYTEANFLKCCMIEGLMFYTVVSPILVRMKIVTRLVILVS